MTRAGEDVGTPDGDAGEDVGTPEPARAAVRREKGRPLWETAGSSPASDMQLPCDPATPFLGPYARERTACTHAKLKLKNTNGRGGVFS